MLESGTVGFCIEDFFLLYLNSRTIAELFFSLSICLSCILIYLRYYEAEKEIIIIKNYDI